MPQFPENGGLDQESLGVCWVCMDKVNPEDSSQSVQCCHKIHNNCRRAIDRSSNMLPQCRKCQTSYLHVNDPEEVCPICLEGYEEDPSSFDFPCAHKVHQACRERQTLFSEGSARHCPLCRQPAEEDDLSELEEEHGAEEAHYVDIDPGRIERIEGAEEQMNRRHFLCAALSIVTVLSGIFAVTSTVTTINGAFEGPIVLGISGPILLLSIYGLVRNFRSSDY